MTIEQDTETGTTGDPWTAYATTVQQYDALGRLTTTTDPKSRVTTIAYDLGGRKTAMTDPDMGSWSYGYDASGNLTTQTDARGIRTTLNYDALNRVTSKSYSDGTPTAGFTYDHYPDTTLCPQGVTAVGQLTETNSKAGALIDTCYDARAQQLTSRLKLGGQSYVTSTTYDSLGLVSSLTYPDGEIVNYTDDGSTNNLTMNSTLVGGAATPIVESAQGTPWGATSLTQVATTTNATTNYAYDSRERLTSIQTGPSSAPSADQNLALTYDNASNVHTITDGTNNEASTYVYDALNRVTSLALTLNGNPETGASYAYDSAGRITSKREGSTSVTESYWFNASLPEHAPIAVNTGSGSDLLTYDPNGNLCSSQLTSGSGTLTCTPTSGTYSLYSYDAVNRITSRGDSAGGSDTYQYDATGTMVKRTMHDGSYTSSTWPASMKRTTTRPGRSLV